MTITEITAVADRILADARASGLPLFTFEWQTYGVEMMDCRAVADRLAPLCRRSRFDSRGMEMVLVADDQTILCPPQA